jgi:nucleoside 2-deoxyribosyltransferase
MKTYLCGPIMDCSDSECRDWRAVAKRLLMTGTADPMDRDYRGHEGDPALAAEIVENDKKDINSCEFLLVNYDKPSVGTSMEILYAFERGKQVFLVHPPGAKLSPWLNYHAHVKATLLEWACQLINETAFV